jgi:hypothetical protein
MELRKFIATTILEYLNENRSSISKNILPNYLYHVTTNYNKVINSGVLLAKSGLDSGGLGGTESFGVSFVTNLDIAKNIKDELTLINKINNSTNEKEILETINNIDEERKQFILNEYNRTIDVYKRFDYAALMAIRLSRNSLKFSNKPFYGLVIFHEENIKNKDIGIIKINKNSIPDDVDIIEGVDKDLGEIRVLGNISL